MNTENMMKGDWVWYKDKNIPVRLGVDVPFDDSVLSECIPIGLTPDDLEYNDFKRIGVENNFFWEDRNNEIKVSIRFIKVWSDPVAKYDCCMDIIKNTTLLYNFKCDTVHQFQHTLKFMGINIDLKF